MGLTLKGFVRRRSGQTLFPIFFPKDLTGGAGVNGALPWRSEKQGHLSIHRLNNELIGCLVFRAIYKFI